MHGAELITDLPHLTNQPIVAVVEPPRYRGQDIDIIAQDAKLGEYALQLASDEVESNGGIGQVFSPP